MITNRSAFDDASPARVMAAILSKEPPPIDAASGVPAEFQWIVQNCLAKDPDARWQSMGDVAKILKGIAHTSHAPASATAVRRHCDVVRCLCRSRTRARWLPPWRFARRRRRGASGLVGPLTLSLLPPAGSVFGLTDSTLKSAQFAVAPDGRSRRLRRRDRRRARAVAAGHEPDRGAAASRHERRLIPVLVTRQSVRRLLRGRISQEGEASRDDPRCRSAARSTAAAVRGALTTGLCSRRIDVATLDCECVRRRSEAVHELGANHLAHRWPQVLRDGRVLLFVRSAKPELQGIYVTSMARPGELRLIRATAAAGLAVAGYLLFVLDGELVAQPLDPEKAALSGEPVPVGLKVSTSSTMSSPVSASDSRRARRRGVAAAA